MRNSITRILLYVLNVLFIYDVLGTCYDCLLGLLLLSLQSALATYIEVIGLIKWYGFIVFGVLIFNIKLIVKQEYIDLRAEVRLKYTREVLKEKCWTEMEKRALWRSTIREILDDLFKNTDISNGKNDSNNGVTD